MASLYALIKQAFRDRRKQQVLLHISEVQHQKVDTIAELKALRDYADGMRVEVENVARTYVFDDEPQVFEIPFVRIITLRCDNAVAGSAFTPHILDADRSDIDTENIQTHPVPRNTGDSGPRVRSTRMSG